MCHHLGSSSHHRCKLFHPEFLVTGCQSTFPFSCCPGDVWSSIINNLRPIVSTVSHKAVSVAPILWVLQLVPITAWNPSPLRHLTKPYLLCEALGSSLLCLLRGPNAQSGCCEFWRILNSSLVCCVSIDFHEVKSDLFLIVMTLVFLK